ncbi:MAG: thiamine phosphate synthase [Alphaproteobacteria bacterium]|nr:thiamine phosphate synthase [Alphaproteobacteria bacterium]
MNASAARIGLDVFYPIVPDLDWLKRLLPLGIRTVQLRIKDTSAAEAATQVGEAISLCRSSNCQLIVNDYWQIAIEKGADFVHLGQEDLSDADLAAIKAAGLRLGISTHSEEELEIALAAAPEYIALGPIYETKLKVMPWKPQGLDRLGQWRCRIGTLPLVGIAGITVERATGVIAAGADSCAVITDFVTHADPEARVSEWLTWADGARRG